jgi:hypothetical protein
MHRSIVVARNTVLGAGVVQLILGMMFWADMAKALVPVHIVVGTVAAVSLLALAILAIRAKAPVPFAVLVGVWALVLPLFGSLQRQLLVGSSHWIIQVLHLLLGVGAMGMASILAGTVLPKRTVAGRDEPDLAGP